MAFPLSLCVWIKSVLLLDIWLVYWQTSSADNLYYTNMWMNAVLSLDILIVHCKSYFIYNPS